MDLLEGLKQLKENFMEVSEKGHYTDYDWNEDPHQLTLLESDALTIINLLMTQTIEKRKSVYDTTSFKDSPFKDKELTPVDRMKYTIEKEIQRFQEETGGRVVRIERTGLSFDELLKAKFTIVIE